MKFRSKPRSTCRVCGSSDLRSYLDLGAQPPSNSFIRPDEADDEQRFPLVVNLCRGCGLSQLSEVVAATDIFDDYAYLSSTSKALVRHYQEMVNELLGVYAPSPGALVIDIGCNDGITLSRYPAGKFKLLGIEPSSTGEYAVKAGFTVEKRFFDAEAGRELRNKYGGASIITATNVFAHVDDIRSFTQGIATLLADDGIFVIEFPYLRDMIEHQYFDTIYHEHLSYLALTPLMRLFSDHGLRPFNVRHVDIGASGPALRLHVCLREAQHAADSSIAEMQTAEQDWGVGRIETYADFADQVLALKDELMRIIRGLNDSGGRVGAYGAPAKGNTMLNYLGVTRNDIVAVAENNSLKIGKLTPGTHLPVVPDEEFMRLGISHALLLTWNYANFFLANSDFIKRGGKFIVPFPRPAVLPA
ncbi:MAG: class I SAM-dependent methyltransferase [Verrucomicrobia bacterium]|nr:class I SAM-dependent methyltransferase [Verrucomicrobiota bacterium]